MKINLMPKFNEQELRVITIVLLIMTILALVFSIYLSIGYALEEVRGYGVGFLEEKLETEIEIDNLSFVRFNKLKAEDVILFDQAGKQLVRSDEVILEYSLLNFISAGFNPWAIMKEFSVDSPNGYLREESGELNVDFLLDKIRALDSDDPMVHKLLARVDVQDGQIDLTSQYGQEVLTNLELIIDFGPTVKYLADFDLSSQKGQMKIAGDYRLGEYDANLELIDLDLAKTKKQLDLELSDEFELSGNLSTKGRLKGDTSGKFRINKNLDFQVLYLEYQGYRLEDLEVDFKVDDYGVVVNNLSGSYQDALISLEGEIYDWQNPEVYLNYQVDNLLLAQIKEDLTTRANDFTVDAKAEVSGQIMGQLSKPEISSQINIGSGSVGPLDFDSLTANLDYESDLLNLKDLEAKLYQGSINASGEIITGDNLAYLVDINLKQLDLKQLEKSFATEQFDLSGLADGDFMLSGDEFSLDRLNLIGNLNFRAGEINEYQFNRFNSDIWLSDGDILLNNTILNTDMSNYYIEGFADLDGELNLIWQAEEVQLEELVGFHQTPDLKAVVDADGTIDGTIFNPEINGNFNITDFEYDSFNLKEIEGRLQYLAEKITLTNTVVPEINTNLSGEIDLAKQSSQFDLIVNRNQLENFIEMIDYDLNATGEVYGSATIKNILTDLEAKGELFVEQGQINGQSFDSLNLNANYQGDEILLNSLNASYNDSYFFAQGNYLNDYLDIEFSSEELFLSDIEHQAIEQNLDGVVGLKGKVYGPISDFRVASSAQGEEIRVNGHQIDRIWGDLNYNNENLYLNDLTARLRNNDYQLNGSINLYQQEINNLLLKVEAGEVRDIEQFIDYDLDINHKFFGTIKASGPLFNPRGNLDLVVFSPDDKARLELTGDYWLGKDMDFEVRANNFNLAAVNDLEFIPYELKGLVNLRGAITGNLEAINLDTDLKITDGQLGALKYQQLSGRIRVLESGEALIDQELVIQENNAVKAYGQIPLKEGNSFDLDVDLEEANLSMLAAWIPEVREARGRGRANLRLNGTWDQPRLAGEAEVSSVSFTHDLMHREIDDLAAKINFSGNQISLESLTANYGEGDFSIKGDLRLDRLIPDQLDIDIEADNIAFEHGSWQGKNDGRVKISGDFFAPLISGDLVAHNTFFSLPFKWPVPESDPDSEGLIEMKPRFDLSISPGSNVRVGNRNINILVQTGSLTLDGPVDDLSLVGRLESRSGEFLYYNTMFELEEGSADFRRQSFIPNLNIKAFTRIDGERFDLNLKGPADSMEFEVGSETGLEQSEALNRLTQQGGLGSLLDREYEDIIQDEMWRLINEGLRIELFSRVERTFEQSLDLDRVRIRPVIGDSIEIGFGKYVINNLMLNYEHTFGMDERQLVGFEYYFDGGLENLTISGNYDSYRNYDLNIDIRRPF